MLFHVYLRERDREREKWKFYNKFHFYDRRFFEDAWSLDQGSNQPIQHLKILTQGSEDPERRLYDVINVTAQLSTPGAGNATSRFPPKPQSSLRLSFTSKQFASILCYTLFFCVITETNRPATFLCTSLTLSTPFFVSCDEVYALSQEKFKVFLWRVPPSRLQCRPIGWGFWRFDAYIYIILNSAFLLYLIYLCWYFFPCTQVRIGRNT